MWCNLDAVPEGAWTWMTDAYTVVRNARAKTPDACTSRAEMDGVMDVTAAQAALQAHVLKVRGMQTTRPDVVSASCPFVPYVWVEHDAMITSAFHIAAWCGTLGGRYAPMPPGILHDAPAGILHDVSNAEVRSVRERLATDVCTSATYVHVQSGAHGRIARLHMCVSEHEAQTFDVRTQEWVGEQTLLSGSICGPMYGRVQVAP